ncbi:(Fe-S)-binding protein [Oceanicella actignis]|uniref:(Fe-S)-binding protein n=1 Tax=Oceanicella actignis TaxID=1189325 RepID=UPI0011E80901|nr:(Fe-S)-binding protein [Oceanicella actignis]TYO85403.1 L-lactate dehydrogenase complex protein LldE [Oceanicella actignis]
MSTTPAPRVALFVTCLVDAFRPSVGFAALRLLEEAGCEVEVPAVQTCCGQPSWNSGDREGARRMARRVVEAFDGYDHVVAPSGSCAATVARDYPAMFEPGDPWRARAEALAARTHEIVSFLTDVLGLSEVSARLDAAATYHDSCSGLRALGVKAQPRKLLASVQGLELREMSDPEACCGFGGTFCVKYPEISGAMVADKAEDIAATGADLVLAGDLGCLMNMAGKLSRQGRAIRARHVVEVLAGMTDGPAIGEAPEADARDARKGKAT